MLKEEEFPYKTPEKYSSKSLVQLRKRKGSIGGNTECQTNATSDDKFRDRSQDRTFLDLNDEDEDELNFEVYDAGS